MTTLKAHIPTSSGHEDKGDPPPADPLLIMPLAFPLDEGSPLDCFVSRGTRSRSNDPLFFLSECRSSEAEAETGLIILGLGRMSVLASCLEKSAWESWSEENVWNIIHHMQHEDN